MESKKNKKRVRRISKKKITIFVVIVILLVLLIVSGILFLNKDKGNDSKKKKEIKTLETIKGYDYELKENETKYYKSLFKELKKVLEADEVDEEKYAQLVSQLFIADFYNLENKISKSDIGGTQFVYKDFRDDFEKIAKTTMYKQVESDVYGERKQKLPEVTKAYATVEKGSFKYGDKTDDNAYIVSFDIEYPEDLGYQKKGKITLIHNGDKLELAALE